MSLPTNAVCSKVQYKISKIPPYYDVKLSSPERAACRKRLIKEAQAAYAAALLLKWKLDKAR